MKAWLGIAVPMLLVSLAWADVYKWVDENGVVHFSDSPPESTKSESVEPEKLELPSPAETQSEPDGEGVYDRAIEDTRAWLDKHNENRARTREEREARYATSAPASTIPTRVSALTSTTRNAPNWWRTTRKSWRCAAKSTIRAC